MLISACEHRHCLRGTQGIVVVRYSDIILIVRVREFFIVSHGELVTDELGSVKTPGSEVDYDALP